MSNKGNKKMLKRSILKIISLGLTLGGLIIYLKGDITNGLLTMILAELIDMPKNK